MRKKIYLAGPDVFRKDHVAHGEKLKKLVELAGFEPLWPMDNTADNSLDIFEGDVEMVFECDAVLANISPFRGPSCDVGTAVEIGIAIGLEKPIFAYSNDRRRYKDKTTPDEYMVEDFQLEDNLMVVEGAWVYDSFEHALTALKERLEDEP